MIAHLDMDAFFARCEENRKPELEGKSIVICIYTRNRSSGAVSTSNYEARELGIVSGMPLEQAKKKADGETVFLEADHDYYRRRSEEVFSVVSSFTTKIQKTSIDEGYFRLEGNEKQKVKKIKAGIESLGLSASVGIAPNKFLAKIASEEDKPDGLKMVVNEEAEEFLEGRELEQLHGVGEKTAEKLSEMGMENVEDLREANNSLLVEKFGREKAASLKRKSRGKGSRKLESSPRKQMSKIKTMERNSRNPGYIMKELDVVSEKLERRLVKRNKAFQGISVISIDTELNQATRSKKVKTSASLGERRDDLEQLCRSLLEESENDFRRIGVRVYDLVDRQVQRTLKTF